MNTRSIYCAIVVSRNICAREMETCRKQDTFSWFGIVVKAGCTFVFILASRQLTAFDENPPLMIRRRPHKCFGCASVRLLGCLQAYRSVLVQGCCGNCLEFWERGIPAIWTITFWEVVIFIREVYSVTVLKYVPVFITVLLYRGFVWYIRSFCDPLYRCLIRL